MRAVACQDFSGAVAQDKQLLDTGATCAYAFLLFPKRPVNTTTRALIAVESSPRVRGHFVAPLLCYRPLILGARAPDAFDFRNFGDRDIPPTFVSRHAHFFVYFDRSEERRVGKVCEF